MAVLKTLEEAIEVIDVPNGKVHFVARNKETGELFCGDFGFSEVSFEIDGDDLIVLIDTGEEKRSFRSSEHDCKIVLYYSIIQHQLWKAKNKPPVY